MRITEKDLEIAAERINRTLGTPLEPYARDASGKQIAQIGNYHISYQYGYYSLYRVQSHTGSAVDVLACGHIKKGDLYNRMHAFLAGHRATL